MNLFLDSFWRALAYCLRPRVIALSILPLLLLVGLSGALAFFFWEPAIQTVQAWMGDLPMLQEMLRWAESLGGGQLRNVLAPLLVLTLTLPLIIILTLLLVAWFMTPAMVTLVAERRFPALERRRGGTFWRGVLLGLGSSLLATAALLMSLPLWFIPPLVMVLPPLIWGWLAYRVMVYDVLAEHASTEERLEIMRRHRGWLLIIGVLTGYMGAAPGMVWAVGALAVIMAPLLVPVAIWIYTFVFSFAALWFAHFALGALAALRAQAAPSPLPAPANDPPALAPHEPLDVPTQS
jgi:hypothetical protein